MLTTLSQKNFKVIVRVRPLTSKQQQQIDTYELAQGKKLRSSTGGRNLKLSPAAYSFYAKYHNFPVNEVLTISKPENTVFMADPEYKNVQRKMKAFSYSNVYSSEDNNQHIFNQNLEADISRVLHGYNCTILAYGITGSGKTYTIFGKNSFAYETPKNILQNKKLQKNVGISYQAFDHLFQQRAKILKQQGSEIKKFQFKFSFIQIYNQNVRDLLATQTSKHLQIVEDGRGNTSVSDVTQICVNSIQEISSYINLGVSRRAFCSTQANQYSSRSHAILQLQVQIERTKCQRTSAKLFVIDLAGSEKILFLNSSKKILEGANINRSLLALGNCITTLSQNSRKNTISHIPYRDSKLTRMLKDSLGGNTRTIMIACISSNPFLIEETTTTLNYALRAQGINKKVVKNFDDQLPDDQFICMKCKKKSSSETQIIEIDEKLLIENPLNIKNGGVCQQLLEQVYEDIIGNAKQAQRIRHYGSLGDCNQAELLELQQVNQRQRVGLKKILNTILIYSMNKNKAASSLTGSGQLFGQNKQNQVADSRQQAMKMSEPRAHNLSGSKSRRRRSHNKFEIPRRAQSVAHQFHQ